MEINQSFCFSFILLLEFLLLFSALWSFWFNSAPTTLFVLSQILSLLFQINYFQSIYVICVKYFIPFCFMIQESLHYSSYQP